MLTATWAGGALLSFALAARMLARGSNPYRMAAMGVLVGVAAFSTVIFAAPMQSGAIFFAGAALIGFGGGMFAVSTLTAAMTMPAEGVAGRGLALGAWGAAQATAAGLSIALGGGLRDLINQAALSGRLGEALNDPATGYSFVYHIEIGLLFVTLVAIGPLVRHAAKPVGQGAAPARLGLAEMPT
jgi:BCD family chlorophyll transporter-like MFS transporter